MTRNLDNVLSMLVEKLTHVEDTRKQFGNAMNALKEEINLQSFPALTKHILDLDFTKTLSPTCLSGLQITGVDGGLIRRRFQSIDLVFTRGIAVHFQFGPKPGPIVDFYPNPFPEPAIYPSISTLSGPELDQFASLERVSIELRTAIESLEQFHSDILLLDGSLLYHPRDRPQIGTQSYEKFQEILALYRQLYHKALKKNTVLVGIVKDSRSTRLTNILGDIMPHLLKKPEYFELMQGIDYRWLLKISRDTDLLDTFLSEGERTFAFRYSTELSQTSNSLLSEVLEWSRSIWVTYIRTAREDIPLRVELLSKDTAERTVSLLDRTLAAILPISSHHPEYGLPAPIVEADARARIGSNEAQLIIDRLMALSGLTYSILEKRRSRNPFGG